jgi:hypothetical protein
MHKWIGCSFFAVLACATSSATNAPAAPRPVPAALEVAAQQPALEARAVGVQIYECKATQGDPSRYDWSLKAPEATLFDKGDKPIGKHYAGPTWESNDGSKVVGQVKARDEGPDQSAIPWLLLDAKSVSGEGVFARTTAIQRLDTVGGKAPVQGCTEDRAGAETRVDYRARYVFYRSP